MAWKRSALAWANCLRSRLAKFAGAALVVCAAGCETSVREYVHNGFKVGPNYCRPAVAVADNWIDYENAQLIQQPADHAAWWRVFNDPILEELVLVAYEQNLTLREAGFRVLEARAQRGIAVGNLFPQQQQLTGSYNRQQISQEAGFSAIAGGAGGGGAGGGAGGGTGFGPGRNFDVWTLGAQLAWELDFWGRFRRAVEAADAELDATVEDYDDVLVILIGDVAETYVEIRTLQQRLQYAEQNVRSQTGSRGLAEERFEAGAVSKLDVSQARTNVAQTAAIVPQLEIQLRQAQNRLCVLLGIPPESLQEELGAGTGIPEPPPEVVVGIPADLIRRRPDVRANERRLAAQSARIGIAEADLYPAFTITGNISLQANQFSDLFQSSAVAGNVGPSFNWNVLNYGRIRNNILVQESQFQQLVATYQNSVLDANREVEDAIIGYLRSQEQARFLADGAAAAEESRQLVQILYTGGNADFGRVFLAEITLVQQQDDLAIARGEIARNLVNVYRALGGGWQIRLGQPEFGVPVVEMPAEQVPAQPAPVPLPPMEDEGPVPPEPMFE